MDGRSCSQEITRLGRRALSAETANVKYFYPEKLWNNFKQKHNMTRFAFLKACCSYKGGSRLTETRIPIGKPLQSL